MTDNLGRLLAEAQRRKQGLETELTIVEAQIRTLTAEVLAEARRVPADPPTQVLRVAGYVSGRSLEEQAEDAYRLKRQGTQRWAPMAEQGHAVLTTCPAREGGYCRELYPHVHTVDGRVLPAPDDGFTENL